MNNKKFNYFIFINFNLFYVYIIFNVLNIKKNHQEKIKKAKVMDKVEQEKRIWKRQEQAR